MTERQTLTEAQLAQFHQLLSHLVASQVPLPEALEKLAADLDGPLGQTAAGVARSVSDGRPLSESLAAQGSFPALYVEMIAAGETTGGLEQVLSYLGRYAGNRHRMHRQFQQALIYPMFVAAAALAVFAYVMATMRGEMTTLTTAFARTSGAVDPGTPPELWGGLLVLLVGTFGALLLIGLLVWSGRVPAWGFRVPVVGRALRHTEASVFCSALALLVKSGVRPERALGLASEVVGWEALADQGRSAAAALAGGESFAAVIDRVDVLPGETRWLLVGAWSQGEGFPDAALGVGRETEEEALEEARRAGVMLEIGVLGLAGFAVFMVAIATYVNLNAMVDYLTVLT